MTDSEKLDLVVSKMDLLDSKVDQLDSKVDKLDSRMETLETDVKGMKTVIENEIRVNIQRVAEGHLDLERHLMEAMRANAEVHMLAIKVRQLESDVKELKQKVS